MVKLLVIAVFILTVIDVLQYEKSKYQRMLIDRAYELIDRHGERIEDLENAGSELD